jgi:hypothetical protein
MNITRFLKTVSGVQRSAAVSSSDPLPTTDAAIGAAADAAYTSTAGSASGTVVGLLKGAYVKLSSLSVMDMPRGLTATFTTLTRPANTTPYSTNDSISNHGTAGSVTALSATVSDTNDAPVAITQIEVATTDTGLGNGVAIRAYIFSSDPTSSTGVGAGDNATYSQKQAGLVATFTGTFHANSDGGVAFLSCEDTGPPVIFPTSGAKTLYIQFQTLGAFTPSDNSTTLIAKAKGYQLRA